MAHKVTVLPSDSEIPEKEQLKRVVAQCLERRGLIVWIEKNHVARRCRLESFKHVTKLPMGRCSNYIPTKMPPREVPNTYFEEPQSATWREQHKMVTFMPKDYAEKAR